ncbi:MAG: hypothetical protein U0990_06760 [Candidatus Nanopelagicales bacterium]|nr:hypothetical protein [Candidatus Nanopelagicales bacterium]MDZ4249776.1 hypothetical protein [Candidatus Nanopelagicales bacterium]
MPIGAQWCPRCLEKLGSSADPTTLDSAPDAVREPAPADDSAANLAEMVALLAAHESEAPTRLRRAMSRTPVRVAVMLVGTLAVALLAVGLGVLVLWLVER